MENPDQGRESDNTNMMEISEDKEQDRSYEEPSASTNEGTSSSTSVYAIQKKKKKKVTFTSSQINQLLTKSNSSSNTSVEITSDDAPITTHQKQKEIDRARQVQQTRGEEGQAQITKPALVITTNMEPQQRTSVTRHWQVAQHKTVRSHNIASLFICPPSACQTQPQP